MRRSHATASQAASWRPSSRFVQKYVSDLNSGPAGNAGSDAVLPRAMRTARDTRGPGGRGAPRSTRMVAGNAVGARARRPPPRCARPSFHEHAAAILEGRVWAPSPGDRWHAHPHLSPPLSHQIVPLGHDEPGQTLRFEWTEGSLAPARDPLHFCDKTMLSSTWTSTCSSTPSDTFEISARPSVDSQVPTRPSGRRRASRSSPSTGRTVPKRTLCGALPPFCTTLVLAIEIDGLLRGRRAGGKS
jgi:hypothetical protein